MTKCEICHKHIWEWQSSRNWTKGMSNLRVKEAYVLEGHRFEYTEIMQVHEKCIKKFGKKVV